MPRNLRKSKKSSKHDLLDRVNEEREDNKNNNYSEEAIVKKTKSLATAAKVTKLKLQVRKVTRHKDKTPEMSEEELDYDELSEGQDMQTVQFTENSEVIRIAISNDRAEEKEGNDEDDDESKENENDQMTSDGDSELEDGEVSTEENSFSEVNSPSEEADSEMDGDMSEPPEKFPNVLRKTRRVIRAWKLNWMM